VDLLVTTRLHGLVLAIKNGVPALAIDAVPGGGKILRQARKIGWPLVFSAENLSAERLAEALDWGLTPDARCKAAECAGFAGRQVQELRGQVIAVFSNPQLLDDSKCSRTMPERLRRFREEMKLIVSQAEQQEQAEPDQIPNRRDTLVPRVFRRLSGMLRHGR
jgi:hypothetical protein